jgi:hypothetical protein
VEGKPTPMNIWILAQQSRDGDIHVAAFQTEATAIGMFKDVLRVNWPAYAEAMPDDLRIADRLFRKHRPDVRVSLREVTVE